MGKAPALARLLGATLAVSAGCGRLGFESAREGTGSDGSPSTDAAPTLPMPVAALAALLDMDTECGQLVPPGTSLPVTNTGSAELVISAATCTGGFVVTSPLPVVIAPGDTATIDVQPPAAVIGTDRAGALRVGTLTLTTNEATPSRDVALVATVVGAELEVFVSGGGPVSIDLTGTSGACPAPAPRGIKNLGNIAVGVTLSGASGLDVSGFVSGTLGVNEAQVFDVRAITMDPCARSGTVTYAVTGPVCAVTPTVLTGTFTITGATTCYCS